MHVTIRKYSGCTDVAEVNRVAVAELAPALQRLPGYRSYATVDSGGGSVTSIGVFDSAAQAAAANATAREVVQRTGLSAYLPNPPEIIMGEILSRDGG